MAATIDRLIPQGHAEVQGFLSGRRSTRRIEANPTWETNPNRIGARGNNHRPLPHMMLWNELPWRIGFGGIMLRLVSVLTCLIASLTGALAAEFKVDHWRGKTVLTMSGPIVQGDAERFSRIASQIPAAAHGLPILLLDSPGGSVREALRISKLMERSRFHTVVANEAKCASACASVIFIAGTYRTVEPFGLLGQHSCSVNGKADQECNDELSAHAVTKGVSHGSVAAFVTYMPPENMVWFTREDADGWGLTRYAGETESGFEKSEPRVISALTGRTPPAQSAWRIDFLDDGFKAFLRPGADHERELQLDVFCMENVPGHLFITMEINGSSQILADAALGVAVATDLFQWSTDKPHIAQLDSQVAAVTVAVPQEHTRAFLTAAKELRYRIAMREPYQTIGADTWLSGSREVLLFAANNCPSGTR